MLKIFDVLRSKYLAVTLMGVILVVVLVATVFLSPPLAQQFVFTTLWFNGLLVLLVVNTACCFFGRLNRRSWDLAFTGMVIFHLSFVTLFLGIVYDKLFFFRGTIRLSEGETLNLAERASYDNPEWGRLFAPARKLKGEITLHKVVPHYTVAGRDKGAACDLTLGTGPADGVRGFSYVTHHLTYHGFRFFREKGGFSPCVVLYDRDGNDTYGACYSLQSLRGKDGTYTYTTGTPHGPEPIPFPQAPEKPLFQLMTRYFPGPKDERNGKVQFAATAYRDGQRLSPSELKFGEKVALGEKVRVGEHQLALVEVRAWINLDVRYNPGRYIIMTSFWAGIAGLVLTVTARMKRNGRRNPTYAPYPTAG
jgi:cytochrome c biogenesis protein ResB